jgi:hypothetical protein
MRWAGIVNDNGVILSSRQREGVLPLLTPEDNEEYATYAISRHKTRTKFEAKIGRLKYAFGRYEGLNRATIPISLHFYLLITLDKEERDFDSIIMEKVIPMIANNAAKFLDFSIEKHTSLDYDSGTFRCVTCAKEFLTKTEVDKHNAEEHTKETTHASG